ncbi:RNA polymerase sigma factor [Streptomyces sp. NPDC059255]|uniref:RNA polymerase sigma factor n=1 Tax=Streptomyces sp. NPDC059255 TaxID=3346793 RepID=UPI0036A5EDA4
MTSDRTHHTPGITPMTRRMPLEISAFHTLHRARYINYAETFLHNRADAEEVTDDTFEQIWTKWDSIMASENPQAYAWAILRNKVVDHARARDRRPELIDEAAFDVAALRQAPARPGPRLHPARRQSRGIPAGGWACRQLTCGR